MGARSSFSVLWFLVVNVLVAGEGGGRIGRGN